MPMPSDYQRASLDFEKFLLDARATIDRYVIDTFLAMHRRWFALTLIESVSCRSHACDLAKLFAQVAMAIEAALERNLHNRLLGLF